MKKIIVIVLVIALGLGAVWYFMNGKSLKAPAKTDSATITTIELGDLEASVTAQGSLEPKEYVDVGAQVSGTIETLKVEIGDTVKTGDLIAEIDPDVYESRAKASQAELKVLIAQKAEQQSRVKQAQQKYNRNRNLIADRAISQEVLQDSQTDFEVADAQLISLNAQIERAQSTLSGDKTNLNYTKIYAPMDGTVVSQSVKEGQTINANQTAPVIVQVANLSVMTARAQVAEADISKLSEGMPVYFTTLGSKDRKWDGIVRQILPTPETINDVVLYNVLVDAENADGRLMTDMTTQMFFVLGKVENVPLVPMSALQKRLPQKDTEAAKAYEVDVVGKDGPEKREVMIGLSDRSKAQVISGLKAGDKVISPALEMPAGGAGNAAGGPRNMMRGMGRI